MEKGRLMEESEREGKEESDLTFMLHKHIYMLVTRETRWNEDEDRHDGASICSIHTFPSQLTAAVTIARGIFECVLPIMPACLPSSFRCIH